MCTFVFLRLPPHFPPFLRLNGYIPMNIFCCRSSVFSACRQQAPPARGGLAGASKHTDGVRGKTLRVGGTPFRSCRLVSCRLMLFELSTPIYRCVRRRLWALMPSCRRMHFVARAVDVFVHLGRVVFSGSTLLARFFLSFVTINRVRLGREQGAGFRF